MDKLLENLRETLLKLGLDEAAVDAALQEAVAKASEEDPVEGDPQPADPVVEEVAPPEDNPTEETGSETPSDDLPVDEAAVTPEGDQVPPTDPVPPVEPTPAVPPFDPTELIARVDALESENAEYKKANEGLIARVQALEEALKNAGVIDDSNPVTEVGDQLPSAAPQNPTNDVFSDVLNEINGGRRH